ncbi:hypothetical protein EMCRGX_G029104 [Ephydatia muelleri]
MGWAANGELYYQTDGTRRNNLISNTGILKTMMKDATVEKEARESQKRTLTILFASLILDLLGFTVILPLMPSLLEYYHQHDKSGIYQWMLEKSTAFGSFIGAPHTDRFDLVLLGGLLGALFSFLQYLSSPILGALSDVYGRRQLLLATMIGTLMSYGVWAISYDFSAFLICRIIGGLSKGNVGIVIASVTDVTNRQSRSKGMALVGIAFSLGFTFGPLIGAIFSIWGSKDISGDSYTMFQYPAIFSLLLSLLDVLFIALMLKETLSESKRAQSFGKGIKGALHLINPVSIFRFDAISRINSPDLNNLRLLGAVYFMYLFLFSGLEYSLSFLVHQRHHYTSMQQGKMYLFIGVVMALVQGTYMRRSPPGSEKKTTIMGMCAIIPGMLIIGFSSSSYMLYSGLFLYCVGAATVVTSITTITSNYGEGDEKGKITGIVRSLGALARSFGPLLTCGVFWQYGACVCYLTGGLLFAVPLILMLFIVPKEDKSA